MAQDKKQDQAPASSPNQGTNKGSQDSSVGFAEERRQLNDVVNSMPPPPNPRRGNGEKDRK